MTRTDLPLTLSDLRRCARALRVYAEHIRAAAQLPENARGSEGLEAEAQKAQDLAARCRRMEMTR
jgi:hypothetical protein